MWEAEIRLFSELSCSVPGNNDKNQEVHVSLKQTDPVESWTSHSLNTSRMNLTNFMQHSPCLEANSCSTNQEISRIFSSPEFHCHVHKTSPLTTDRYPEPGESKQGDSLILRCILLLSFYLCLRGPPLWSSGQSFRLQIQRSRVRFPALPDFSE